MSADPRFGEPVTGNEVAGLAVAFKALVLRAGGRVEITEAELLAAQKVLMRVDADPEVMVVEVAEGAPPDLPRSDQTRTAERIRSLEAEVHRLGDCLVEVGKWFALQPDEECAVMQSKIEAVLQERGAAEFPVRTEDERDRLRPSPRPEFARD
jgi:hypothetical protein